MSTKKSHSKRTMPELAGQHRCYISVSFGLRADDLQPAEISSLIGLEPSHAFAKGDEYEGHIDKDTVGIRERPHGVWDIRSDEYVTSSDPEEHAMWLLGQLEPRASIVRQIISRRGMYADVRIWVEMDGPVGSWRLKAETLSHLTEFCHDVNFSYIGTSDD